MYNTIRTTADNRTTHRCTVVDLSGERHRHVGDRPHHLERGARGTGQANTLVTIMEGSTALGTTTGDELQAPGASFRLDLPPLHTLTVTRPTWPAIP